MYSAEDVQYLRNKCKTDLFFLGKTILGKDFEEDPHMEMCDLFIHKSIDKEIKDQDKIKMRVVLYPRGSFKSTIDLVDAVQWILVNPDVRIFVLTAEKNLAEAFTEEVRNYFVIRDNEPTEFQQLFPEYCISDKVKDAATQFTTPARTKFYREPTIWSNSINSSLPGWHCDILKCDDIVNNLNAVEPAQIEKITRHFNFARKLVDPGGYVDVIGTPYNPDDLYAYIKKHENPKKLLWSSKPAWTVKKESKNKLEEDLREEDYELFFPSRLTYEFLSDMQKSDPITFESQYLINPYATTRDFFSEKIIHSSILDWKNIPMNQLTYYGMFDLAYGVDNKFNDETAGAVVGIDQQGRRYVLHVIHGRYSGSEIAFQVADLCRRYPLKMMAIEDTAGARWLSNEITRAMNQFNVNTPIYFMPVDWKKDAKKSRILAIEPQMRGKRFFFSSSCPNLEDVLEAFKRYTGARNSHDDIPDVISFINVLAPDNTYLQQSLNENIQNVMDQAFLDMVYPSESISPTQIFEEVEESISPVNYF